MDQTAVHLRPKSSNMLDQFHLPNPHFSEQQCQPQKNIPNATEFPNTLLPHTLSPTPNLHMDPPPNIPQDSSVQSQLPVILAAIQPRNNPQRKPVRSHSAPCYRIPPHRNVPLTVTLT